MPVGLSRRTFLCRAVALSGAIAAGGRDAFAIQPASRVQWFSSLVWIVLENHGYRQVANLPSHRRLGQEGMVLTQYFAVSHPSGPNYRAMASGETWGHNEEVNVFHPSVSSEAAKAGIPSFVYHLKGTIARKHNPLIDLRAPVAAEKHGMAAFTEDLTHGLPAHCLVYCGWDNDNDAHDGSLETADRNVSEVLDALAASSWFTIPDELQRFPAVFLCWDEDDDNEGNHVFAAWWGRKVRAGTTSALHHTHYGFCRTMSENWYLPTLGQARSEGPMTEAFTT